MEIISPANASYKKYESLTNSKGIKKEGLFLISGEDLVREFLQKNKTLQVEAEIVPVGKSALSSSKQVVFSKKLFATIDIIGTHFNILVVTTPAIPTWKPELPAKGLEVLIPLGDPGNLGACLRSCEAFAANLVVLTSEAANPFLPKAVKASSGSCYRLNLANGPGLQDCRTDKVGEVIGLDAAGAPLNDFKWPQNLRLLVGEEGSGLGHLTPKILLNIPTQGVESLNAVVATSIALFHYRNQFRLQEKRK